MCETSTGLSVCGCVALVTAEGFISANRSPSQKFFKHLDHCSEQLFFQTHEHFCVCTVTDRGQTRNQVEWTTSLCEAGGLLPGDWLISELNVVSCQGREKVTCSAR